MFLHVKDSLLPKLPASTEKGTDFDPRVVEAYANQSQAEAQEGKYKTCWLEWGQLSVDNGCSAVTLARALELGHKPGVVSALSIETSELFTLAGMSVCVCLCTSIK